MELTRAKEPAVTEQEQLSEVGLALVFRGKL